METLLVTGGSGFVGKNIVSVLEREYRIISIDRHVDRAFFSKHPLATSREVDSLNKDALAEVVDEFRPDYVINLVSVVTAERDLSLFSKLIDTDLRALLELYDALKGSQGLKLFVQFGSAEEYGNTPSKPFSETDREYPDSPYGLIKLLTTNTALMLQRNYGFPAAVVRPGNLFGRYQPIDKFVPYVYRALESGQDLFLTPGEQKRDFIFVEDFVIGLQGLMRNYQHAIGSIFNLAYGEGVSVRQLVEQMKQLTHSTSKIHYGAKPYRMNEMMDFQCDIRRFREVSGVYFERTAAAALERYVKEMREEAQ